MISEVTVSGAKIQQSISTASASQVSMKRRSRRTVHLALWFERPADSILFRFKL
jgi:hypothetical protein